ncbi:unnamed protein product [Mytilus edulis]|uniref:TNFR-Cys domain-containing protein n=1 Tax=Mytilus edulis TaxID=6550 RepID=A0A8S3UHX2_MYTED|nr:unnamed protein product [Mytilus edulis]
MYSEVAFCFFLVSFFIICNCQLSSNGQCFRNISTSEGISVQTVFCCRNFEPIGKNNTCKVCESGFTSDGSKCEPCRNRKYGEKMWRDMFLCHHKYGCVSDREVKHVSAITSREQMLIVIIILLGLLLLLVLLRKYCNTSINPPKSIDRKLNETGHAQPKNEEGIESVYNEIDELAMNTITSNTSFHHSYLELPNILSSKLTTKDNTFNTPSKCELGFTSDGTKCEPCPSDKFGEKNGETCFCHDSERCHNKYGCVSKLVHGTDRNNVIIFMISIAVIGIIVIIIWTVWRCRFKLLHFTKLKRRKKLGEGRHYGLQIETEVDME